MRALSAWEGLEGTEPEGWMRVVGDGTGRRRPGGDPGAEYQRP